MENPPTLGTWTSQARPETSPSSAGFQWEIFFLSPKIGRGVEAETALQTDSLLNKEENEEEGKEDLPQSARMCTDTHTHTHAPH